MTDASQLDVAAMLTEVGVDATSASPEQSVGNTTILRSEEQDTGALPTYQRSGDDGASYVKIGDFLAEDAFSVFYAARQNSMRRQVTVRTVHPNRRSRKASARVLRDGWMLGALEHPNIIPVHGIGKDENADPIVVLKHTRTVSWEEVLSTPGHALGADGADRLEFQIRRLLDVCAAAGHAHELGVVHRDIKTANVLLDEDGTVYLHGWHLSVKLVGDGSGRFPLASEQHQIAGTPAHMAPELATKNFSALSARTDVYLLGATLHHAVTGRPRHLGENVFDAFFSAASSEPVAYGEDVPEALARILNRCMARDPAARYASAVELADALRRFLRQRPAARLVKHARQAHSEFDRAIARRRRDYIVRELFATAYTAYSEALQFSRDDADATEGLNEVVHRMITYELENGSTSRTRDLLARLDHPPAELARRVADAVRDPDVSRSQSTPAPVLRERAQAASASARRLFMYATVVVWTSFGLMFGAAETFGLMEVTRLSLQVAATLCWVALGGVAALAGPGLLKDLTQRYVVSPSLVVVFGSVVLQMQSMLRDGSPHDLVVNHLLMFFILMATVNALFDWRLAVGTAAYLAAYIVGVVSPEYAYWLLGAANLVGLGFTGYVVDLRLKDGEPQ